MDFVSACGAAPGGVAGMTRARRVDACQADFIVGIADVALRLHPGDRWEAAQMAEHVVDAWREAHLRRGETATSRAECQQQVGRRLGN